MTNFTFLQNKKSLNSFSGSFVVQINKRDIAQKNWLNVPTQCCIKL